MLGLLLARAGVAVIILEKHADFLRDFRGDSIHPSTLEVMGELALLDELLRLPHQTELTQSANFGGRTYPFADFTRLPTRCKFIALMPQWDFLNFLVQCGKDYPSFQLRMRTEVVDLIEENGRIAGVYANTADGPIEVRADLTVACDGRHSIVRARAGLAGREFGVPMDTLWFRLGKGHTDPAGSTIRFDANRIFVAISRGDYWQCAFHIPKGSWEEIRRGGLSAFRRSIVRLVPEFTDRLDEVEDWEEIKLLAVTLDRLDRWHRPGLLCIGDAAHAMSPIGGVGVNLAVQDAVAAANILWHPLKAGTLRSDHLRLVQKRRMFPTRFTQRLQAFLHSRLFHPALTASARPTVPLLFRLMSRFAALRHVEARLIALGVRPEHVHTPSAEMPVKLKTRCAHDSISLTAENTRSAIPSSTLPAEENRTHTQTSYDVLICGAGLAGLSLARQLKLELPSLSVALIERSTRPLPEAAHKVGEATTEIAGHYFAEVLHLQDYLAERQLPKLGLRFFLGNAHGPFEDRNELGPKLFSPSPAYLIDRGRIENDLRAIVADMGVQLLEATTIDDIELAKGARAHTVLCHASDGCPCALSGRWLIDALGRRRFLQSKLGLGRPNAHSASAAWWRINARIDVSEMAANPRREWRRRIIEDRYLSTNHLMGRGYWVWLIPLSSGATSIGIVTDETIHPSNNYAKSYEQSLEWLREHEPAVWRLIKGHVPLDFHRLKDFSYHAGQIFSLDRWSCVGEAGIFLDPLYSPGSDFIAIENTITVEMIRRDAEGKLTEDAVADFNRLVLDFLAPIGLAFFKDTYRVFGHAQIYYAKHAWDQALISAIFAQMLLQDIIRHPSPDVFDLLAQYKELNERVQRLLIDWSDAAPARAPFLAHTDLGRSRFHQMLHLELATRRTHEQFLQAARLNLQYLEEMAQILFWQAVKECLPQYMPHDRANLP
jgi:2-polyprenyl-6-methoxyphenol hydroxylase-like FAD-dependent oxidoreductase